MWRRQQQRLLTGSSKTVCLICSKTVEIKGGSVKWLYVTKHRVSLEQTYPLKSELRAQKKSFMGSPGTSPGRGVVYTMCSAKAVCLPHWVLSSLWSFIPPLHSVLLWLTKARKGAKPWYWGPAHTPTWLYCEAHELWNHDVTPLLYHQIY